MGAGKYLPPSCQNTDYRCFFIEKSQETWEDHLKQYGNEYYSDEQEFYKEKAEQEWEDIVDGLKFSTFLNTAPNGMLWLHDWVNPNLNTWRDKHFALVADFEYNELLVANCKVYFVIRINLKPDQGATPKAIAEQEEVEKLLLMHLAERYPNSVYEYTSHKLDMEPHIKAAEVKRKHIEEMAKFLSKKE